MTQERVLLINPWIHDFAAYDFWLRPMGLLYLASRLRRWGFEVHFVDCLDRYNPRLLERQKRSLPRGKADGRGMFDKEEIPKPPVLREVPRRYSRYGLPPDIFLEELASLPEPNVILVTWLDDLLVPVYPVRNRVNALGGLRRPESPCR